jgi:aminoglycoside/choline kinase family phosphotransferase
MNAKERLTTFLAAGGQPADMTALAGDASTREYFRIKWNGNTAIACVYPEPFTAAEQTFLDTTKLFRAADLPVAEVIACSEELGIIVQEDLGDTILRDVMLAADEDAAARLRDEAISLIVRIQAATDLAYKLDSIASKLRFDREKLLWEMNYFKEHYFTTLRNTPLSPNDEEAMDAEFIELVEELEERASVLCHRDFHAANLMLDTRGRMRIIDHQDARIGSAAYDLVSLLLDRITELPSPEWLAARRKFFIEMRTKFGMPRLDEEEFAYEFRLQTIQRCLKAAGTFSYQSAVRGKTHFLPFIKPMFGISRRGAESLGRFPHIRRILTRELERSDA